MNDHPRDALEAYVFGDLDAAQAQAVLDHADDCPSCAAVLGSLMHGIAALAEADGEQAPKARPKRFAARPAAWFAGLAAAAALAMGVWNVDLQTRSPVIPVDALVHSHFAHHALSGTGGNAKILVALDGSWVYLVADGLPRFQRCTLAIDGASLGTVAADGSGRATAFWTRPSGPITQAALNGAGTDLRWSGK